MPRELNFVRYEIIGNVFEVPDFYQDVKAIGVGGFGLVCSATYAEKKTTCAIKKIKEPFLTTTHAKRAFREFVLLKNLVHDNIINLGDVYLSPSQDLYLVTELCSSDLHSVITSQALETSHIKYFVYQMVRALKYVHSAGVFHRDLKPSNILVNESCDLKICDFGLARIADPDMTHTGYVATRYYRAPEVMLFWQHYNLAVDMWSVGCIFAEMLLGRPLFPGRDHVHQFSLICDLLGTPGDSILNQINSENTRNYVNSLARRNPIPFSTFFAGHDPDAIDLMQKMLTFDPTERISAKDALEHPFCAEFHDPEDEPDANQTLEWAFEEKDVSIEEWKMKILSEIETFEPWKILKDDMDC